ncbi:MAG TPA: hypothetical protein DCY27_04975 [Desulfobacterales bacterium]|nr:hypothetical protein [Desulfobacterales bacterium]
MPPLHHRIAGYSWVFGLQLGYQRPVFRPLLVLSRQGPHHRGIHGEEFPSCPVALDFSQKAPRQRPRLAAH